MRKVDYVKKSSYRTKVVKSLGNDVKRPMEIAEETGILSNHISNVLRQLKEKKIVKCINPKMKKGRLYRLTDEGLNILNDID